MEVIQFHFTYQQQLISLESSCSGPYSTNNLIFLKKYNWEVKS